MAAPTVAKISRFSVGNLVQTQHLVTLGAASGVFDTGLSKVLAIAVAAGSAATAGVSLKINLSSSATSVNGRVSVNSGASGDDLYITCWGKP